jgi:hypothetical protein
VSVAAAWTELINKLDFKQGRISIFGIELASKFGSLINNKTLKCSILGAVVGFKLGSVIGTGLGMGTFDGELCTVLDIRLGSKLGAVFDREPSIVVLDIKLDFKLGTVLDRELFTVFDLKRGLALDNEVKFPAKVIQVIKNTTDSFGAEIGSAFVAKPGSILGMTWNSSWNRTGNSTWFRIRNK